MGTDRRSHFKYWDRFSSSVSILVFTAVQSPLMCASIIRSFVVGAHADRKIIITANRTEELKVLVDEKGYDLIFKPIKPAILRNIINKLSS